MTATKLHSAIRNPRSAGAARQAFRASHCPGAHTSIQHSSPCMAPAATRQAETAPSAVMARLWPALVAVCCVECSWSVPLPTLTLETPYTPITEHTTGPLACSVSSVEKPPPVPREAPHVAKSASRSGEPVSTRVRRLEPFDSLSCAIARLSTAGADSLVGSVSREWQSHKL